MSQRDLNEVLDSLKLKKSQMNAFNNFNESKNLSQSICNDDTLDSTLIKSEPR